MVKTYTLSREQSEISSRAVIKVGIDESTTMFNNVAINFKDINVCCVKVCAILQLRMMLRIKGRDILDRFSFL